MQLTNITSGIITSFIQELLFSSVTEFIQHYRRNWEECNEM